MKPLWTILIVISIGLIGLSIVMYLLFWSTTGFISAIDGNSTNTNYTHIVGDYYVFNVEKSICLNTGDGYTRVTGRVDSLCWNDDIIAGYSNDEYFLINVHEEEINRYSDKDSLSQFLGKMPSDSISLMPSIK